MKQYALMVVILIILTACGQLDKEVSQKDLTTPPEGSPSQDLLDLGGEGQNKETEDRETEDRETEDREDQGGSMTNESLGPAQKDEEALDPQEVVVPVLNREAKEYVMNPGLEFTKHLRLGWNLGNTFDAVDAREEEGDDLRYETLWVGTKTTKEIFVALKEAGFRTVRIPVSWHNHLEGEEQTISEAWLLRVKEVVDMALAQDLYVILNIHHDIDPAYYYPDSTHLESSTDFVSHIWDQLAQAFKTYDDRLIFEAVNEPRLVGTNNEWWFDQNNPVCIDAAKAINTLNQVFVDRVRLSGGQNLDRYLMVPGYAASADGALSDYFELPRDERGPAHHLIVSVHAYTPYNFALQGPGESGSVSEFDLSLASSTKDIHWFMDGLFEKFIIHGVPVVIGEFGARDKGGNLEDRVNYAAYYVNYASQRGIPTCWWDNHAFLGSGENFGLLERSMTMWAYPKIVEALNTYAGQEE